MQLTRKMLNLVIKEEISRILAEASKDEEESDLLDPVTDEFDELDDNEDVKKIQSDIDEVFSNVVNICAFDADHIEDDMAETLYEIRSILNDELEKAGIPRDDAEEIIGNKDHKIFWENILKVATLRIKEYQSND